MYKERRGKERRGEKRGGDERRVEEERRREERRGEEKKGEERRGEERRGEERRGEERRGEKGRREERNLLRSSNNIVCKQKQSSSDHFERRPAVLRRSYHFARLRSHRRLSPSPRQRPTIW